MVDARARAALAVLTAVNVLNYVDRYVITAILPDIQRELGLDDTRAGLLGTAFMLVYFVTSPIFGFFGDRGRRKRWLAFGVGLWSLATALGGFAQRFVTLVAARSLVGVGEAAYGSISPSLIADYFPKARRGRMLAVFFLAIPVGSALGYLLGGVLGKHLGWRPAFFVVGFPGLLLALAVLLLHEPVRGAHDAPDAAPPPRLATAYRLLATNPLYVWTVLGYTAYTFAIGGLSFWIPSYMMRVRGFDQADGMMLFGGLTVVTGFVGTLLGGYLGDRLLAWTPKGYTWLGVVAVGLGAGATVLALVAPFTPAFVAWLAVAELLLFLNTGPINALILDSVRPQIRATAMAASIFVTHLLGDAISPTLIGSISDRTDLQVGMLAIPAVFLLASALWAVSLRRPTPATP
ncbi:MAG: MFS transporter [Deltaproteobacteria bacterium]|nr:MFS transporter [Deltaproteobacteria bacterium]